MNSKKIFDKERWAIPLPWYSTSISEHPLMISYVKGFIEDELKQHPNVFNEVTYIRNSRAGWSSQSIKEYNAQYENYIPKSFKVTIGRRSFYLVVIVSEKGGIFAYDINRKRVELDDVKEKIHELFEVA